MCVLAFAWRAHPRWRFVAVANRDELHARGSTPLAEWGDAAGTIAGRDLVSGGTWLGVTPAGRFATVTNVRQTGIARPDAPSRGALVTDALAGVGPMEVERYSPFNLIAVDGAEARFTSNRPEAESRTLDPGVYGIANAGLDEPWPKTVRLKAILSNWIAREDAPLDGLFDGLGEEDADLATGSIFIRHPVYGTRCSTIVTVDTDGVGIIAERRFSSEGDITGESRIVFRWP